MSQTSDTMHELMGTSANPLVKKKFNKQNTVPPQKPPKKKAISTSLTAGNISDLNEYQSTYPGGISATEVINTALEEFFVRLKKKAKREDKANTLSTSGEAAAAQDDDDDDDAG